MSEKLYLGQLFNNFDEFIQTLNEYSKQSYSIWTTVSSRKLEDNNFKYLEIKCIHHREINDITSKSYDVVMGNKMKIKLNKKSIPQGVDAEKLINSSCKVRAEQNYSTI
ncbi:hypothetical protein BpHYR1_000811 [Brachionus plicatilis]|uniref:Uncharacterized protein n=1 Tax=Brachionus plicatilis TaxID=10195 RepID=A0A3M7QUK6_BRAPC|nr:hypothetical protein BpHYR1_000811 [Brachionus plicatilis]